MYYIFQMYIPCVCVVALSWVSFWINHEAVPARVALSITTVLTISYMRGSVNAGMPRVSYLKSIDYFLLGGFVFIFMTLLEYVLVLKQSRKLYMFYEKKDDHELTENGEEQVRLRIIMFCFYCKQPFCRELKWVAPVQFCSTHARSVHFTDRIIIASTNVKISELCVFIFLSLYIFL